MDSGNSSYIKSRDGVFRMLQLGIGFLAWILLAATPYAKEGSVGRDVVVFHLAMALAVIAWIFTLILFILRISYYHCGLGADSSLAKTVDKAGNVTREHIIINAICFIVWLVAGALVASNVSSFYIEENLYGYGGSSNTGTGTGSTGQAGIGGSYSKGGSYGYNDGPITYNNGRALDKRLLTKCLDRSINQRNPECVDNIQSRECQKITTECFELASTYQGQSRNGAYYTAILSCVCMFITAALYLAALLLVKRSEGFDDAEGADVTLNRDELNASMRQNSWKQSRPQSAAKMARNNQSKIESGNEQSIHSQIQGSIVDLPRDSSTVRSKEYSSGTRSHRSNR